MGEPFYCHEFWNADRTGHADASEIVACKIDEHCMLRTFLCIGTQVCRECGILLVCLAPFARPGDGIGIDGTAGDFDQHLGRRADQLYRAKVVVEHIRRRVDLAQAPIEEECRARDLLAKAKRRHCLKDIAGIDMLFNSLNHIEKIGRCFSIARHKVHGCLSFCRRRRGYREGGGKSCTHCGEAFRNHIVEFARIVSFFDIRKIVQLRTVSQSIVDDEIAAHHELPEQLLAVEFNAAHTVECRCRLIGKIARKSAVYKRERLSARCIGRNKTGCICFHRFMRRAGDALHETVLVDEQFVCKYLHTHKRLASDERVTAELLLGRVDGLHNVALFVADELVVDRDGSIEIHRQLSGDCDQICSLCRRNKCFFRRRKLHPLISMTTSRSFRPRIQPRTLSSA